MFKWMLSGRGAPRRRGVVAVQVAVLLVVLIGFAALTVDLGAMYNTKGDLQRTVDAAALAAASKLADWSQGDPTEAAREAAMSYVRSNHVMGHGVELDPATDLTFGRVTYNGLNGQFDFTPNNVSPDAVSIRLRHTADSPNGAVPLFFARIFGRDTTEMQVTAMAMMVPRDIAIVADLSASHTDDSEFRNHKTAEVNMYEVWDGLPGGSDDVAACSSVTCPAGKVCSGGACVTPGPSALAGPSWGYMKNLGFGTTTVGPTYNATTDPGLVRLQYNSNWSNSTLRSYITGRGYSSSEADALMASAYDSSGAYPFRVAVALGLAEWNSGKAGGRWQTLGLPAGNNNNWVSANELQWTKTVFNNSLSASDDIWVNYIDSYMRSTNTEMYDSESNLRYRFGIKTFVNYLLETRVSHAQTPELSDAPAQPMEAVKEAVGYLCDYIDELDTDDQISLEVYGTTGRHEVNLTHDHQLVATRLREMQAGHYDSWTNTGGGIAKGIEELTGVRARSTSTKMMILLTDGNANVSASGQTGNVSGGNSYALQMAEAAATQGIVVFAVSVGAESNQSLMEQIADIGGGEHFFAGNNIEEYSEQLAEIFRRLGGTRPVQLIR